MTDPITRTQLENAASDADSLSHFVNDDASPGTYTTRLGRIGKVLAWLENAVTTLIGSLVGIGMVQPTLDSTSAAAANVTLINAALAGGGTVRLVGNGIAWVNAPLIIGANTRLLITDTLTIKQVDTVGGNVLQSACYTRTWDAVTVSDWDGLLNVTLSKAAHGRSKGEYYWLRGEVDTTPPEYFGIFLIVDVPDADTFVVQVKRRPSAEASGDLEGKLCDQNITVEGGLWDYNYRGGAAQPAPTLGSDNHAILLAGIQNLKFDSRVQDVSKYALCVAGIRNFEISLGVPFTNSDHLKGYGPIFDGQFKRLSGTTGDDGLSLQCMNPAAFTQYEFAGGGDILNVHCKNIDISANIGAAYHNYPHDWFLIDGIVVEDVHAPSITDGVSNGSPIILGGEEASGKVGHLIFRNIAAANFTTFSAGVIEMLDNFSARQIDIDGINIDGTTADGAQRLVHVADTVTIQSLNIRGLNGVSPASVPAIWIEGAVNKLTISEGATSPGTDDTGSLVKLESGCSVDEVVIRDFSAGGYEILVEVDSGITSGPALVLQSVTAGGDRIAQFGSDGKVSLLGPNNFSGATDYVVAAIAAAVKIYGGAETVYPTDRLSTTATGGSINDLRNVTMTGIETLENKTVLGLNIPNGIIASDGRLGIGTTTPSSFTASPMAAMVKDQNAVTAVLCRNANSGALAAAEYHFNAYGNSCYFGQGSLANNGNDFYIGSDVTSPVKRVSMGISTGDWTLLTGQLVVATQKTPASASAAGVKGTICADASFIYVCTATNTWKRVAIAAW